MPTLEQQNAQRPVYFHVELPPSTATELKETEGFEADRYDLVFRDPECEEDDIYVFTGKCNKEGAKLLLEDPWVWVKFISEKKLNV